MGPYRHFFYLKKKLVDNNIIIKILRSDVISFFTNYSRNMNAIIFEQFWLKYVQFV